jgi:hypothetical protein
LFFTHVEEEKIEKIAKIKSKNNPPGFSSPELENFLALKELLVNTNNSTLDLADTIDGKFVSKLPVSLYC